jgi:putative transposase
MRRSNPSQTPGPAPSRADNIDRLRDECLNETLFNSLSEAREVLNAWKEDYNRNRPHSALGNLTPKEFAEKLEMDKMAA